MLLFYTNKTGTQQHSRQPGVTLNFLKSLKMIMMAGGVLETFLCGLVGGWCEHYISDVV